MRRPPLWTVLATLSAAALLTPFIGIFALRIYDTELIRQTESELIAQAAFAQAGFRIAYEECALERGWNLSDVGRPSIKAPEIEISEDGARRFRPLPLSLRLDESTLLPSSADPELTSFLPDPCALQAGEDIAPLLREAQEITLAGIRIVDSNFVIVSSTRVLDSGMMWKTEESESALNSEILRTIRQRNSSQPTPPLDSFSRRGGLRVYLGMPIWVRDRVVAAVVISRTPVSLDKALYDNRDTLIGLGFLVLVISGAVSALASLAIGRPVKRLMEQVHAIEGGESAKQIAHPGTSEFEELSRALERMDESLQQRNTYVRDFARNVSHEFKTPLTSILGAVELMSEFEEMPVADRQAFLNNISSATQRMERLVVRLHELARAETSPLEPGVSEVIPVVEEIRRDFAAKDFLVEVQVKSPVDLRVGVAPEVVDSLIRNLIENAQQHGASPATIRIDSTAEHVIFEVSDAGPGVSEGNAQKVFETFFTTSRDRGGTGLGLSIVRSLAEIHGGSLSLNGRGASTVFRLALPRVRLG